MWARNYDLPAEVKKLPEDAQTFWRSVANEAMIQNIPLDDAKQIAWGAIERNWKKDEEGIWVRRRFSADELRARLALSRVPRSFLDLLAGQTKKADDKLSKEDVDYRGAVPGEDERCGNCVHFNDGACELVAGEIDPDFVSNKFEAGEEKAYGYGYGQTGGHKKPKKPRRKEVEAPDDDAYVVYKSREDDRFTFGPIYAPGILDAHKEFVDADTLEKAIWGYVQKGDRTLHLQHGDQRAGEWVNIVTWPFETTVKMDLPNGGSQEISFPAGTSFMGALWDEPVWKMVKKGELRGFSFGGFAHRLEVKRPE